jgi:hypothetical protein
MAEALTERLKVSGYTTILKHRDIGWDQIPEDAK